MRNLSVLVTGAGPTHALMWIGAGIALTQIRVLPQGQLPLLLIPLGVALVMLLLGGRAGHGSPFQLSAVPFIAMLAGVDWSGRFAQLRADALNLPSHRNYV